MPTDVANTVRSEVEQLLKQYWQARYEAYVQGLDQQEDFLADRLILRETYQLVGPGIPPAVHDAYDYYLGAVERQDWGVVRLYRVPLAQQPVYAVRVTTDGDDGWLELYDQHGTELGVGRTYLELVGWGEKGAIRSQTQTGEFPPALNDRDTRTLWGK